MRTNYNSSNQNSSFGGSKRENSSTLIENVNKSKDVDTPALSNPQSSDIHLSHEDIVNSYMGMVSAALEKKDNKGNTLKDKNKDGNGKDNEGDSVKKKESPKKSKTSGSKKKSCGGMKVASVVMVGVILGGIGGFLVRNYIGAKDDSMISKEESGYSKLQSMIDDCYTDKNKVDISSDVSDAVLSGIDSEIDASKETLSDKVISDLHNEVNGIRLYLNYKSGSAKYSSPDYNLEDSGFDNYCKNTMLSISECSIEGLRKSSIDFVMGLISTRNGYLKVKYEIEGINDEEEVKSFISDSYQEYINNLQYSVNRGYLQALVDKLVADKGVLQAKEAYDKASKAAKAEAKKVLDDATSVQSKALTDLQTYKNLVENS